MEARWYSNQHVIKDPFDQAKGNKYSLLEKLREIPFWKDRWLTIGHAVAFPDIVATSALRLDAPEDIVLDGSDLTQIERWVDATMAFWRGRGGNGPLGEEGVQELVKLLSPSWELRAPLALEFADESQTFVRLTEEQFNLLDFLNGQRRAAIAGCAGSGKTMLALEKAKRLAEQGFRVLLTCYNRYLAEYLAGDETLPPEVEVRHFHSLCWRLAREAGLGDETRESQSQEWYNDTLPQLLMSAADKLGPQYDAIVVDEGQDFREEWLLVLLYLLKDPDAEILYIFYDDNQNLYQEALRLPAVLPVFSLHRNCRNTRHIHDSFLPFYRGAAKLDTLGPLGGRPRSTSTAMKKSRRRRFARYCIA